MSSNRHAAKRVTHRGRLLLLVRSHAVHALVLGRLGSGFGVVGGGIGIGLVGNNVILVLGRRRPLLALLPGHLLDLLAHLADVARLGLGGRVASLSVSFSLVVSLLVGLVVGISVRISIGIGISISLSLISGLILAISLIICTVRACLYAVPLRDDRQRAEHLAREQVDGRLAPALERHGFWERQHRVVSLRLQARCYGQLRR
jgi:hypothetical protein